MDYVVDYGPFVLCAVAIGALVWALVRRRHTTAFTISLCLALGLLVF
jgi:hypothetical protein